MSSMNRKKIKRNAVIVTVILFFGTAVYLNWNYGDREDRAALAAEAETETPVMETAEEAAEPSLYYAPETEPAAETALPLSAAVSDYFSTARLTRQQARDSAISLLKESTELENASTASLDTAMEEISVMAASSLEEAELETLIKAKGFADCVVFLSGDSATVAVSAPPDGLSAAAVARITEVLLSETGLSAEQIKIIEVK